MSLRFPKSESHALKRSKRGMGAFDAPFGAAAFATGFFAAFATGFFAAFATGFFAAFATGFFTAFATGFFTAFATGFFAAFATGFFTAFATGFFAAFATGFFTAFATGFFAAFATGFFAAFATGFFTAVGFLLDERPIVAMGLLRSLAREASIGTMQFGPLQDLTKRIPGASRSSSRGEDGRDFAASAFYAPVCEP
jgi:hypothetical protein